MTNKEAIGILNAEYMGCDIPQIAMAYQMAIKALEAEPTMTTNARSGYVTIKAEPCEDAISRQAALDAIFNNAEKPGDAYRAVRMIAPVTPKQRTGRWIYSPYNPEDAHCSKCLYAVDTTVNDIEDYKFCPLCGAKMEGE